MTDDQITRSMTNAMRLLNKTGEHLQLVYDSIDDTACPVCACGKLLTQLDLQCIEETRTLLIEKSRDPDRDERIVAATKAIGVAMMLVAKAYSLKTMADAAHEAFDGIAQARIEQVITGPEGQAIKEALEKALSDAGFTKHQFDPTKVN
jgi:hypothetical protein